jgi:hypothetical protein
MRNREAVLLFMFKSLDNVFNRTGSTEFAKYSRMDRTLSVEKLNCGVLPDLKPNVCFLLLLIKGPAKMEKPISDQGAYPFGINFLSSKDTQELTSGIFIYKI